MPPRNFDYAEINLRDPPRSAKRALSPEMFTVRRWLSAATARGGKAAARVGSVPRIGELRTAREVLQAHERHALQMRPVDVSSCWSALGKLWCAKAARSVSG